MYKKTLLTRFQMVYLNASWIDTVEKLWPFENFEHKNYENGYTIRANTLIAKIFLVHGRCPYQLRMNVICQLICPIYGLYRSDQIIWP